ncbi:hypothetical protein JR316_0003852 [Psilocybe cubensis]|uniref:Uncharacterized protein n=2 Tax=Psilocybe cubensis TaxID=181762 RepID=A0ACB8H8Y6_PSICU|nr:hypothetical protein JR316_0003852 [Psilocybe cubensis]KAH9484371.1 hypothetical protein JR316_0003852 [Psilocybe cubensis]
MESWMHRNTAVIDPRQPRYAPILPVEIWEKIFAFATHIPGCFEVDDDYAAIAAFTRDRHGICLSNRYREAMQAKLAFCLVCKYWSRVAQPIIFEHLRIRAGEDASLIADTLKRLSPQKDCREGPGRWTIRIDLVLEGVHAWLPEHTIAMSRIFKHCPNLASFSSAFSTDEPWTYELPKILRRLSQNSRLTRLEVKADHCILPIIEETLGNRLEILWLVPCRCLLSLDRLKTRIVLPNIRALIATAGCETYISRIELPSLRACILGLATMGFPLINRSLVQYCSISNSWGVFANLNDWPSLTTLSVNIGELANLKTSWERHIRHEHLECIMIENIDHMRRQMLMMKLDACTELLMQLDEMLTSLLSPYNFPHLKCVKIFLSVQGRSNTAPILLEEEESLWYTWLNACNDRGVRIEVSGGAMEWTGDEWTDYSPDEVFDML